VAVKSLNEGGAVPDAYTRLADVLGLKGVRGEFVEAFLNFQGFGATLYYASIGQQPAAAAPGVQWPAASIMTLGPRQSPGSGFRLENYWVKNTVGGSAATVVVQASIEDGQ